MFAMIENVLYVFRQDSIDIPMDYKPYSEDVLLYDPGKCAQSGSCNEPESVRYGEV